MLPITWTVEASEDLDRITDYIAERSPQTALDMFELAETALVPAFMTPLLFRAGREMGTREIVAHPNYIVVYHVLEDAIEVVNVIHARQCYPFDQ
ncbi:Death on curing protein, Doc toxin [Candidatus Paraburkholderia calva]|nr:Death on curing protein, Doc toxin [Candidatus Paraburkholderia calva]